MANTKRLWTMIKPKITPFIIYSTILLEYIFINTLGNKIYSYLYNYTIIKIVLFLCFHILPMLSIPFINRLIYGKHNYKNKIQSTFIALLITIIFTAIYIIIASPNDNDFNCIIAGVCCIEIAVYSIGTILIYVFNNLKKHQL